MSSEVAPPAAARGRRPRALLIRHEPEARPAVLGALLRSRGVDVLEHVVLGGPHPDTAFPDLGDVDLVVSFGSFSNAYDPRHSDWVRAEVELIRESVRRGTPFLGVCFGGQLLGMALGGSVERAPAGQEEVGVVTVEPTLAGLPIPAGPWFAWHEDRIRLPEHVEVLATTDRAVQVFRSGRAVGLQFHPEVDGELIGDWLRIGAHHLPPGMTADELLAAWAAVEPQAHRNVARLVDWLVDELMEPVRA